MKGLLLAILLLSLAPAVALAGSPASSPAEELRGAKAQFDYGEFAEARATAERLLTENVLTEDNDRIEANRIAGLCHFYAKDPEGAEGFLVALLSIDPDYKLDPFFTPPAAVGFLENLRSRNAELLAPIREQKAKVLAARRRQEEMAKAMLEAAARKNEEALRRPQRVREVSKHYFPLVFLPLGAGQFQNQDPSMGILLATVQVVSGLTSVVSYNVVENLRDPATGDFTEARFPLASTLDVVKWAAAGVFYVAWGYGVADAWANFTPESVREVEVAPPSPADGARPGLPPAATPGAPSPAPGLPGAHLTPPAFLPFAGPTLDGGAELGFRLRF